MDGAPSARYRSSPRPPIRVSAFRVPASDSSTSANSVLSSVCAPSPTDNATLEGLRVHTGLTYRRIRRSGDDINPDVEKDGVGEALEAEAVLAATGRRPNTADLGLADVDVALTESGGIPVDRQNTGATKIQHAPQPSRWRRQRQDGARSRDGAAVSRRRAGRGLWAVEGRSLLGRRTVDLWCRRTIGLALLLLAGGAQAQTLDRVRDSGTFKIGYREDAAPFSYEDALGEAAGYSVELCRAVAANVSTVARPCRDRGRVRPGDHRGPLPGGPGRAGRHPLRRHHRDAVAAQARRLLAADLHRWRGRDAAQGRARGFRGAGRLEGRGAPRHHDRGGARRRARAAGPRGRGGQRREPRGRSRQASGRRDPGLFRRPRDPDLPAARQRVGRPVGVRAPVQLRALRARADPRRRRLSPAGRRHAERALHLRRDRADLHRDVRRPCRADATCCRRST